MASSTPQLAPAPHATALAGSPKRGIQCDPDNAFQAIYLAHYAAVAGLIYRRTGDVHLTEDLTADTFAAALAAYPRYRPSDAPIAAWLLRIATNRVNRWARRRAGLTQIIGRLARLRLTESPPPAAPEYPRALAAMLSLSPEHQAVLSLHHVEGLPLEQVALVLEIEVGTVKSRLARAREALRRELLAQGDTP